MSELNERLQGIRLVVLDAVGTVITPRPSVKTIYWSVGQKFGSRISEEEVDRRFRAVFRETERNGAIEAPNPADDTAWRTSESAEYDRWHQIVAKVLDDVEDLNGCFEELFKHFAQPTAWHVYPDVGPALRRLQARGLELALASNFDFRLHSVCDALPDLRLVTRRFISSQIGVRKPARAFFEAILAACRVSPSEVLMVGDDATNDVAGARACNLRAVRVNRKTPIGSDEIADLSALVS